MYLLCSWSVTPLPRLCCASSLWGWQHYPVWLKNCAASRSLSKKIGHPPAKALSIGPPATLATHSWLCGNELIVETLMIPHLMIIGQVPLEHIAKGCLADHDHLRCASLTARADP